VQDRVLDLADVRVQGVVYLVERVPLGPPLRLARRRALGRGARGRKGHLAEVSEEVHERLDLRLAGLEAARGVAADGGLYLGLPLLEVGLDLLPLLAVSCPPGAGSPATRIMSFAM
jgi:hypothetical protein